MGHMEKRLALGWAGPVCVPLGPRWAETQLLGAAMSFMY